MFFNCDSRTKGNLSLNYYLEQRLNLNPNILDIILAFLKFNIVFCSDIEKAFLMIRNKEGDGKYSKFLWYPDDDSEDFKIMRTYRVSCVDVFILSA